MTLVLYVNCWKNLFFFTVSTILSLKTNIHAFQCNFPAVGVNSKHQQNTSRPVFGQHSFRSLITVVDGICQFSLWFFGLPLVLLALFDTFCRKFCHVFILSLASSCLGASCTEYVTSSSYRFVRRWVLALSGAPWRRLGFPNCADLELFFFFPLEKRKEDDLWATEPPGGFGKFAAWAAKCSV